jgi:hypothetical protein
VAGGEPGRPDFQRHLVDPEMDLAPDVALRAAVLSRGSFARTLDFDPGTVDRRSWR